MLNPASGEGVPGSINFYFIISNIICYIPSHLTCHTLKSSLLETACIRWLDSTSHLLLSPFPSLAGPAPPQPDMISPSCDWTLVIGLAVRWQGK